VNAVWFEAIVKFKACNFLKNTAQGYGGAIYIFESGNFSFESCNFENNQASYGGAIYFDDDLESMKHF